ncbi:DUF308 domain-containing protein [Leifsonia sp. NPDC058248]|uniref:DUF308 domain-containing protein n=1 Tax=Leifsonia sp. NPDC058248 TaxID=3346402 RepID=UPI0036D840C7
MTSPAVPVSSPTDVARALRTLYLVRAAFSIVWVILVLTLTFSVTVAGGLTPAAAILLVVYPAWDFVATLWDLRVSGRSGSRLPQLVNAGIDAVAVIAMVIALFAGLQAAIVVFGAWALVSGAVQLTVALRRRSIGGQWPMLISGGLSVLAGLSFILMAGSPKAGIVTFAGYSAFGAVWYLVAVATLSRTRRR